MGERGSLRKGGWIFFPCRFSPSIACNLDCSLSLPWQVSSTPCSTVSASHVSVCLVKGSELAASAAGSSRADAGSEGLSDSLPEFTGEEEELEAVASESSSFSASSPKPPSAPSSIARGDDGSNTFIELFDDLSCRFDVRVGLCLFAIRDNRDSRILRHDISR